MLNTLIEKLQLPKDIPVIIGGLGDFVEVYKGGWMKYYKELNAVLKGLSEELPCSGFADASGLTCKNDGNMVKYV